jgi:hypothetical protein
MHGLDSLAIIKENSEISKKETNRIFPFYNLIRKWELSGDVI